MLSKNKIKLVLSLHQKKYRQKYNKIIVEGSKLCAEIMDKKLADVLEIFATETFLEEYPELSVDDSRLTLVKREDLKKITVLKTPSEVLMVCVYPQSVEPVSSNNIQQSLYLDGIRDPGNMGTILRTADWFGIQTVFLSQDCVEVFSPKVIQASMGSAFRVKCIQVTADQLEKLSQDFAFVGTDMDGLSVYQFQFPKRVIIVLGNEGQGMSENIKSRISGKISIPGADKLGAESLNVSISAGIILSELQRKRME